MIKNMTIKQLLNTDIIEKISEAVDLLIEKMNDLNKIVDRRYFLGVFENGGEIQLPSLGDENIENYGSLGEFPPRQTIKNIKSKCCEVKRGNNKGLTVPCTRDIVRR